MKIRKHQFSSVWNEQIRMYVIWTYASGIPNANEFFKCDWTFAAQHIGDRFQLFSKIDLFFVTAMMKSKERKKESKRTKKGEKKNEKPNIKGSTHEPSRTVWYAHTYVKRPLRCSIHLSCGKCPQSSTSNNLKKFSRNGWKKRNEKQNK